MIAKYLIFIPALLLNACVSHITPTPSMKTSADQKHLHMLYTFYKQWKRVPYRYGGCTEQGVDCSCFVRIAIKRVYGKTVPRTTVQMLEQLKEVPSSALKTGDLVFFHTFMSGYHVGIYLEKDKFLEASTQGIRVSSLLDPYWNGHYVGARGL